MKTFAYLLLGLVTFFCFMESSSLNAEASDYLGEYCFEFKDVGHSGSSWVSKVGVFDNGGGHYYLSGVNDLDGDLSSINGNAEISGNNIIANMNSSIISTWGKTAATINMTLDLILNGTYFSMAHEYNGTNHDLAYYHGIVTFVSCP